MKKRTFVIIFIIIVIIIALLLFMAFRNPENRKKEMCPDGKTPIPRNGVCPQKSIGTNAVADETGCVQPSSYQDFSYPIQKGMRDGGDVYDNKQVSVLQNKLNTIYKAGLDVDGNFGCLTQRAVQKHLGVTEVAYSNPIWQLQPILG